MSMPEPAAGVALSVIIVTWNCRLHLERCLQTLRPALAGLPSEIIVVDNASQDGAPAWLRAEHPDVILIEIGRNAGFAAAANRGLAAARGEYLWLLNPDAAPDPDAARRLLQALDEHPRAGAAGPRLLHPDGSFDRRAARRFPTLLSAWLEQAGLRRLSERLTRLPGRQLDAGACRPVPLLSGAAICLRRAALEQVGGFDEVFFLYGEDLDWCRRLAAAGWQALYCGAARVAHAGAGSSAGRRDDAGIDAVLSLAAYFRKHDGPAAGLAYRAGVIAFSALKAAGAVLWTSLTRSEQARRKAALHCRLIASLWRGRRL
jgi:N-acetylglucosaminyl-diphospho-decaprenol L-rhamnosyltransferase